MSSIRRGRQMTAQFLAGLAAITLVSFGPARSAAAETPVPGAGAVSLAGRVYVPVTNDSAVYVIDPATHTVVKRIDNVGDNPIVLRATPDQRKIYVDNFGPLTSHVTVIDTATNSIVKKIPTLGFPYASMAMSHDGRFLLVPTAASLIQVIDTTLDRVVKTFPIAGFPIDLEIAPDDQTFYAFSTLGTVAAYSTATGRKVKPTISAGGQAPGWAQLSADGSTLYSVNFLTSDVEIIDTAAWRSTGEIKLPAGSLPLSATLTPDEKELWICNIGTYDVTVVDVATRRITRVIPSKGAPAYVGFNPAGTRAYLSDLGPASEVPANLRWLYYDIHYLIPPGGTGYVVEFDARTKERLGATTVGNGPVAGLYF